MEELRVLNNGGIILYPTDTVWGLGCDATQPLAIRKIIELKGRSNTKNLILLVKDISMLRNYVESIPQAALEILEKEENPITIIYPNAKNLPIKLLSQDNSIGIRIPKHQYLIDLITKLGRPLVSTSANISGHPSPNSFADIDQRIISNVDYISSKEHDTSKSNKESKIVLIKDDGSVVRVRG